MYTVNSLLSSLFLLLSSLLTSRYYLHVAPTSHLSLRTIALLPITLPHIIVSRLPHCTVAPTGHSPNVTVHSSHSRYPHVSLPCRTVLTLTTHGHHYVLVSLSRSFTLATSPHTYCPQVPGLTHVGSRTMPPAPKANTARPHCLVYTSPQPVHAHTNIAPSTT